jgi:hypothetical protein
MVVYALLDVVTCARLSQHLREPRVRSLCASAGAGGVLWLSTAVSAATVSSEDMGWLRAKRRSCSARLA